MEIPTLPAMSVTSTGNEEVREEEEREKGEDGDRFSAGNRWPRQETLALLKIRSEMDVAFKDTNIKGPLWEEASRKMSELGYKRSAKKCKEKFENIYKYHRRTKESGKLNGKNYKFFEQLEALDHNQHIILSSSSPDKVHPSVTGIGVSPANIVINATPCSVYSPGMNFVESTSTSTTSTTSKESDGMRKKKRKLMEFFEGLMKEIIEKQESLQKKFLEAIEKCEQNRMVREEAWKMQELDRIRKERELLAQERSIAAAKDAAILSFLQKFSNQGPDNQTVPGLVPAPVPVPVPMEVPEIQTVAVEKAVKTQENNNSLENYFHMSSSRWPKEEIEALIRLRTNFDLQYQDNVPKGPLWEEISAEMKRLGYDRNAKRCKEKWENMNKYYKRVKDNNKKRREDSKSCAYFHQLAALQKEKTKIIDSSVSPGFELKPEELLMHMMGGQGDLQQQE